MPAGWQGGGSSVSYTADGLTDTSADFSNVPAGPYPNTIYVRAMPVRHTGTVTAADERRISQTNVDFSGMDLKRGEIVRSGNIFAIIEAVDKSSDDAILLEGWLDNDTLLPAPPPAAGATYTVFGLILGQIADRTITTLTCAAAVGAPGAWFNLHGDYSVLPAAGTPTRSCRPVPATISCAPPVCSMSRSAIAPFRRSHHDQLNGGARKWQVVGSLFEDGQDVGFSSAQPGQHQLVGNDFHHQGSEAIYVQADDFVVTGNRSVSAGWRFYGHAAPTTCSQDAVAAMSATMRRSSARSPSMPYPPSYFAVRATFLRG